MGFGLLSAPGSRGLSMEDILANLPRPALARESGSLALSSGSICTFLGTRAWNYTNVNGAPPTPQEPVVETWYRLTLKFPVPGFPTSGTQACILRILSTGLGQLGLSRPVEFEPFPNPLLLSRAKEDHS